MMNKLTFKEFLNRHKEDTLEEIQVKYLEEAGNVSSGLLLKRHNDKFKHGKDVLRIKLRDRDLNDKLDALARQIDAVGSIGVIAGALSGGEDSFLSKVAQGSSVRSI